MKNHADRIQQYIQSVYPQGATNREIVRELDIHPHQAVFQITRMLMAQGKIRGVQGLVGEREWTFYALVASTPAQPVQAQPLHDHQMHFHQEMINKTDRFTNPQFKQNILGIARAYGSISFWEENLPFDANPEATWRAVLVCACLDQPLYARTFASLLRHPDSRVRGWACFGLGQCKDPRFKGQLEPVINDGSGRVRMHARLALAALGGPHTSLHHRLTEKPLVLVSEDNEHDRASFAAALVAKGYTVLAAGTARETIALTVQRHPIVITTDNQKFKDNLSGMFMTQDISRNANLMDTSILMITQDEIEAAFLWHGGDLYLHKATVTLEEITDAVDDLCR